MQDEMRLPWVWVTVFCLGQSNDIQYREKWGKPFLLISCPLNKDKWDRSKANKPYYISGSLLSPENRRKYIETYTCCFLKRWQN